MDSEKKDFTGPCKDISSYFWQFIPPTLQNKRLLKCFGTNWFMTIVLLQSDKHEIKHVVKVPKSGETRYLLRSRPLSPFTGTVGQKVQLKTGKDIKALVKKLHISQFLCSDTAKKEKLNVCQTSDSVTWWGQEIKSFGHRGNGFQLDSSWLFKIKGKI